MDEGPEHIIPLIRGQVVALSYTPFFAPLAMRGGGALQSVVSSLSELLARLEEEIQATGEALAVLEERLKPVLFPAPEVFAEGVAHEAGILSPAHQALVRHVAGVQWLRARVGVLTQSLALPEGRQAGS